jgi:putative FmdB family regulatory protein
VPLYEYRCPKCGKTFEKIQKFSDRPRAKCPECGVFAERQISAPAIRFKGTGWYVTDYAGKGKPGDGGKPDAGKPDAGKKTAADGNSGKAPKKKDS